jgi:hypothetical protein
LHAGKEPAACANLNRYSRASSVSIHIWYAAWHGLRAIACLSIAGIMGKHRHQKSSILNYQDARVFLTPRGCHPTSSLFLYIFIVNGGQNHVSIPYNGPNPKFDTISSPVKKVLFPIPGGPTTYSIDNL